MFCSLLNDLQYFAYSLFDAVRSRTAHRGIGLMIMGVLIYGLFAAMVNNVAAGLGFVVGFVPIGYLIGATLLGAQQSEQNLMEYVDEVYSAGVSATCAAAASVVATQVVLAYVLTPKQGVSALGGAVGIAVLANFTCLITGLAGMAAGVIVDKAGQPLLGWYRHHVERGRKLRRE